MRESKKIERLWLSQSPLFSVLRSETAELDQAGFLRVDLQRKLLQPHLHGPVESLGIVGLVTANNDVIGITDNDDVSPGVTFAPLICPEIKNIV